MTIFFRPTRKFLLFMEENHKRDTVIDAGAGECFLTVKLRQVGINCIPVDPLPHGPLSSLVEKMFMHQCAPVRERPFCIVAARPDHSGWVTEIPRYMHRDSVLLYVWLKKNLEHDLDGLSRILLFQGAGKDGECVWEVPKQKAPKDHEETWHEFGAVMGTGLGSGGLRQFSAAALGRLGR